MINDDNRDETATRLLATDETIDDLTPSDTDDGPEEPRLRIRAAQWQVRAPRRIIVLIAIVKFTIVCSGMLLLVPLFRLIEDAICHGFFDDTTPEILDEKKCKVDGVQARLATFLGWSGLVSSIVTLITSFPFGAMSDRFGRKPVALLSYSGVIVSFLFTPLMFGPLKQYIRNNPYLLMSGNVFMLVGGGIPVLLQTLYAMASDVSTEEQKAASFLYLSVGSAAGGLLGPLFAGLLMNQFGPWVPIWIVISISPCLLCILLLLPETLAVKADKLNSHDDEFDLESGGGGGATLALVKRHMRKGLDDLRASLAILRNRNVPIILVTSLFQNARMAAYSSTLVQYVSKNYGWTLGETSILLSPLGVLAILVLGSLPHLAARLTTPLSAGGRFGLSVFAKDLLLTRASTALLIAGAAIQGLSPNVAVFILGLVVASLGTADSPLARATVSHYVAPAFTSRLYALMGMVEVLGSFLGAPALAYFFNVGLAKKGLYTGLPYFYIAVLCTIALVALMFVTPPVRRDDGEEGGAATPGLGDSLDNLPSEGAIRL